MNSIKNKIFLIVITLIFLLFNAFSNVKKILKNKQKKHSCKCDKNSIKNKHNKYYKYDKYLEDRCERPIPRPNPELKTIALLELSDGSIVTNNNLAKTFEYYFATSPQFKKFPIVDTSGTLEKTIELLDRYYKLGYRIFIGFSRSSILQGVLDWFNSHPKAIGISPLSTSPTLEIPKNIYRISPNDGVLLSVISLTQFIKTRDNIYYIYSKNQLSTQVVLDLLLANPDIGDKIIPYAVEADSSNITTSDLSNLFTGSNPLSDINIIYLFDNTQRPDFFSNYAQTTTLSPPNFILPTFDISLQSYPILDAFELSVYNGLYYVWTQESLSTSELWRNGKQNLGNNYQVNGLNTLQLNNYLSKRIELNQMSNYSFVQQFDPITKDTKYFTYINYELINGVYVPNNVIGLDPLVGKINQNY